MTTSFGTASLWRWSCSIWSRLNSPSSTWSMLMSNGAKQKIRPFPWKCRNCRQVAVSPAIVSYPARLEHDGRVYEFTVDGLKAPQCQNCHEIFPDAEANR